MFLIITEIYLFLFRTHVIYKWTRTREIPCHRSGTNGRKLVFKRDEIVAWMTARKQETKDEFIKRMESQLAARLRK